MSGVAGNEMRWPELPWDAWADTANTLHMWTQIVGKTRMVLTPLQNHWWNVPLYVTARGLGTSAIVYGNDVLDIEFDFVAHELQLRMGSGAPRTEQGGRLSVGLGRRGPRTRQRRRNRRR